MSELGIRPISTSGKVVGEGVAERRGGMRTVCRFRAGKERQQRVPTPRESRDRKVVIQTGSLH